VAWDGSIHSAFSCAGAAYGNIVGAILAEFNLFEAFQVRVVLQRKMKSSAWLLEGSDDVDAVPVAKQFTQSVHFAPPDCSYHGALLEHVECYLHWYIVHRHNGDYGSLASMQLTPRLPNEAIM
jgi:hypothetical protein